MENRSALWAALRSAVVCCAIAPFVVPASAAPFRIEEATIPAMHAAIKARQITCRGVVEAYIARARAYNGICTMPVTRDGADIAPADGYIRAGALLSYPTKTVAASRIFPNLDQYRGLPLDYGRMEPTKSDPSVMTQRGMRVGIPNAHQINALETLNIRGERSVACKGSYDAPISRGPLPAGAPAACDILRRQPDALERASELDARYGDHPDLRKMPMYCVVTEFKDTFDTKDMRTTASNDVAFAMDVPPKDSTIAARLRAKGAIIYAKSVAEEFNSGPSNPGGDAKPRTNQIFGGQQMGSWAGQSCNPYDTERVPRGSSGGSGASVGANLAMVGICEQTSMSCQGPASRNGIAMLVTTKGLMPDGGGIGNQSLVDRAGIHARTLGDAARVLDALKDSKDGYYDSNDIFAALPKQLIPANTYTSYLVTDATKKPLKGLRIAVVREHFVKRTRNHATISDVIDHEIKAILRDQLGAELVELTAPGYPDDPTIPNAKYTFSDALSELLPRLLPDIFTRRNRNGELAFAVPGYDVTSQDYLLKLSQHQAPLTGAVNITNFSGFASVECPAADNVRACDDFAFDMDRYLAAREDVKIKTWRDWASNAEFRDDRTRAAAENWAAQGDHHDLYSGDILARSFVGRQALLKIMHENKIDLFVFPENTVPTPKIQGPNVGAISLNGITPFLQVPQIVVPAGFNDVIYEAQYALNADKTNYISILPDDVGSSRMPHPMPIAMTFFAGPGDEPILIKVGTAFEAATHYRAPPSGFGPVARAK